MADGSPGNPQPLPTEPWLEGLTFEQIEQIVTEVSPDAFYQRASAFDQAGARMQDVLDRIRHEMNALREVWGGASSDDFDALVREVTGKAGGMLQFLRDPGYGTTLRDVGDRLADHQRRLRDLAGQKAQQESGPPAPGAPPPEVSTQANNDSAKQILRDLRTAYWDIGNALPGFPYDGGRHWNPQGQEPPGSGGADTYAPPAPLGPATSWYSPTGSEPHGNTELSSGDLQAHGGHGDQVLGRAGTGGQGPEAGVPGGRLDAATFAGGALGPAVLGRNPVRVKVSDGTVSDDRGEDPFTGIPAVLGRSGSGVVGSRRKADTHQGSVSHEIRNAPAEPKPATVTTIADAPGVPRHGSPHQAVTAAAISATPQEIPGAAPPSSGLTPPPTGMSPTGHVPTSATFDVDQGASGPTMSHGGGTPQSATAGPEAHGLHAVGMATPDGFTGPASGTPVTGDDPAAPGQAAGTDSQSPQQAGGFPMSPMMLGGMAGGMSTPQHGRMADMPNEPRPQVWDPVTSTPVVVGRSVPEPEPKPPPRPELSKEDIHNQLAEKFAELDRLTQRRKDGGN